MSATNINRWTGRSPRPNNRAASWAPSTAVAVGDLIYQEAVTGYDKPAALFTWAGSLSATQIAFKAVFGGVSETMRLATQTTAGTAESDGGIQAGGEFTFPCAALAAAQLVGAFVGVAQGVGLTLASDAVAPVAAEANAIGRLTRPAAIGDTEMTFNLIRTLTAVTV